jgi:hypothetical protein
MVRKQIVFAAAAAAGAVTAVLGITDVFASSAALPGPGVIPITATTVSDVKVDTGRRGRSVGDLQISRQRLFCRRSSPSCVGKTIGHAEMVCTSTGGRSSNCSGTYFLPKGKIVVSGPKTFREIFEVAVVGGTGIYDNVRGTLTVTSLGGKPERFLVFFRLLV